MKSLFFHYRKFIIGFLIFSSLTLTLFYIALKPKKSLPIYNPSDVNPELVDTTIQYKSKYHRIENFSFSNQNGKIISQKDYEGIVYVADFFFTSCKSICPKMTSNLIAVQKEFLNNPKVKILSFSVTPDIDNVSVLKEYARINGVNSNKWNLVTGDKKSIYTMARKSYLVVKQGSPNELYDMIHTENFVLVDTKKRIRGFYDGTKKEAVDELIKAIYWLLENE